VVQSDRKRKGIFCQRIENIPNSISEERRLNKGNKKARENFRGKKTVVVLLLFHSEKQSKHQKIVGKRGLIILKE